MHSPVGGIDVSTMELYAVSVFVREPLTLVANAEHSAVTTG
jgi:hypothetical protein